MAEIDDPEVQPTSRPQRRIKVGVTDIIILTISLVIIISLAIFIVNRLKLKQEVSGAKSAVASKVITALSKQDTKSLRSLGDSSFQAKNSAASLNTHLTATTPEGNPITFAELYGKSTPTLDKQIVANNARGQHVVFVYRYSRLKAPLFVRIDTTKPPANSHWYLQALTVGTDEAALTSVY